MSKVKRLITVFEKGNDEFLKDEIELSNVDLSKLQVLLSVEKDKPMYDFPMRVDLQVVKQCKQLSI